MHSSDRDGAKEDTDLVLKCNLKLRIVSPLILDQFKKKKGRKGRKKLGYCARNHRLYNILKVFAQKQDILTKQ